MRRVASLPLVGVVSLLLAVPTSALAAAPQLVGGGSQAEPTGTGRLTVTVLAGDTGAPVKQVLVTLFGTVPAMVQRAPAPVASATLSGTPGTLVSGTTVAPPSNPVAAGFGRLRKEAQTDDQGRLEFTSLPGGQYSLSVAPPSPFVRPQTVRPTALEDGGARSIVIRLERGGVISGRLLDAAGDPVTSATVYALADRPYSARIPTGRTTGTDDRGQYRIFDLPAGAYLVLAVERGRVRPPSAAWEPHSGPLPTYYPGTGDAGQARLVAVTTGQEVGGVDFSLAEGRLGRVRARVIDSAGQPVPGDRCGAALVERTSGHGPTAVFAHATPDGGVVFPEVPPGDYILTAELPRSDGQPGYAEGAYLPIRVDGLDLQVEVQTNRGATLSGRIRFEGPAATPPALVPGAPPSGVAAVSVATRPASAIIGGGITPGRAEVRADGTFQLTGVRGSVIVWAGTPAAVVKSITRGGDDLMGAALDLRGTERIDDIEIVLTTEMGNLSGTVVDARGQPVPGTWLVAFAENPTYWFQGSPLVRPSQAMTPELLDARLWPARPDTTARPGGLQPQERAAIPRSPGRFALLRLLPGRYYVAAIPDVEGNGLDGARIEKAALARLRPTATMATVVAGQTTEVVVRIDR